MGMSSTTETGTEKLGTCGKCVSEISIEATVCPQCGYEPSSEGSLGRTLLMLLGFILSLTIVGAIVGLPLIYFGWKSQKYHEDLKPTETDPDDTVSVRELIDE